MDRVRLIYVVERYRTPLEHGPLRIFQRRMDQESTHRAARLASRAFVENYLSRKRGQASLSQAAEY